MYTINFQSLSVRNFLSVGNTPLVINFNEGVSIITGINRDKEDSKNGVGKSTVIDALYFALYGSTIRELTKDLIVNSFNKKDCEVILDFQVIAQGGISSYKIVRQLSPTKCTLTREGEDITLSTIPKTNELLQSIIRTTGNVFQNSVVMTANSTVPFMAQSKNDKRKFIENILNLEVFSSMLGLAREEYNNCKKDYEVFYSKHEMGVKMHDTLKQQLDVFESNKHTRIQGFRSKIVKNNENITVLESSIKNIPNGVYKLLEDKENKTRELYETIDSTYKQHYQESANIKAELQNLKNQLRSVQESGICPACKRELDNNDPTHKTNHINELIVNINNVEKTFTEKINLLKTTAVKKQDVERQVKENLEHKKKIEDVASNNKTTLNKISFIKENNKTFEEDIVNIEKETNESLEKNISAVIKDVVELKESVDRQEANLKILDYVKFIVSEEGVKSYIVKKILSMLNSRLAFYLKSLHSNCGCTFNEFFEDTIIDEQGNVKSYFNFSGGERKRIDLACLFAFLDIRRLQGDVTFSTIFYDELLDSALDDKGVELVIQILQERCNSYKESCYIITHRGTTVSSKIDNIITLEKRNGMTYILNT